jgi:uracil-DNA glycosylase
MTDGTLEALASQARACTHCADRLPLGPNPIVQVHPDARVLIASQAPGRIAHRSGIPFQDASGRRLRDWMGMDEAEFYDPRYVAILPMGFCYPGRGSGGDLPPRPECAQLWREAFLERLTGIRLTLLIGAHAQRWHLAPGHGSVADSARQWLRQPDRSVPLPHPSPRNNAWLLRHPWFEAELIPKLRTEIAEALRP